MRVLTALGSTLAFLACSVLPLGAAARVVTVTVQQGRRMVDWCRDLEARGPGSLEVVSRIAASERLPEFTFLPPRELFATGTAAERVRRFEGLFVPGTYGLEVPAGGDAYQATLSIIRQLLEACRDRFQGAGTGTGLGVYASAVLASIVEKEAVRSGQQALIASTLLNRMQGGMRLSCCSTVEYVLGYHRPFLLLADISRSSPYNTYQVPGLPPTPICFFSDQAWKAAIRPPPSPYLFFLYDWATDQVMLAADYPAHQANVERAHQDFVGKFGEDALHRAYADLFYEQVP